MNPFSRSRLHSRGGSSFKIPVVRTGLAASPARQGMTNKAVVVGALGVIWRYIAERLIEEPDWQVVGLSRRKALDGQRYRHIAVDLLEAEEQKHKLGGVPDIYHDFYTSIQ